MKGKGKASRLNQPDVPVVLDSCGVDVNDPNGSHLVNFTFKVTANDDPEKPFEGDIELVLPHNLPKNSKPPKIELSHPSTEWNTTLPVMIDDNFLNQIREKRFIYRIVFLYKATSHGKGPARGAPKKGADKGAPAPLTNHTFFVDVSNFLVRGGRFRSFLSCTETCQPPGFENFTFSVSIDHSILSDAQIRRYQPFVVFFKGVHQMPNTPISYDDLACSCVGPFLVVHAGQQTFTTFPQKHGPEMKLNTALVFWQPQFTEITIELRDREIEQPEMNNTIGSSFALPFDPKNKPKIIEPLLIDQILGGKKETTERPYGTVTFKIGNGRQLLPFKPITIHDCLMQPGFYIENGTYLTIEMESMKDYVPVLQVPVQPATPIKDKRGGGDSKGHTSKLQAAADKNQQQGKQDPSLAESAQYSFNRCLIVCKNVDQMTDTERNVIDEIQKEIVLCNSVAFNIKDLAAVPTMKIQKIDSDAISGFYMMFADNLHIIVLEFLDKSKTALQFEKFLKATISGEPISEESSEKSNLEESVAEQPINDEASSDAKSNTNEAENEPISAIATDLIGDANQNTTNEPETKSESTGKVSQASVKTVNDVNVLGPNFLILYDFSVAFKSSRLYGNFDCAVKKFKLSETLDHLLEEPTVYVQNSHLSNLFTVLNQLNQLRLTKKFSDIEELKLWPKDQELEMLNAKKGVLLSMDELSFPPKNRNLGNNAEEEENNEDSSKSANKFQNIDPSQFVYHPINEDIIKSPPHDVNYFVNRNMETIRKLESQHKHYKRGLISVSEDGEVEIWDTRKGQPPKSTGQIETEKNGVEEEIEWDNENPEKFMSLAQSVSCDVFSKRLRSEDGTEKKNGVSFNHYKVAKTFLPPIEKLKANVNNEPWTNHDLSLASCDTRWINETRGPVYTSYNSTVHPRDSFNQFQSLMIEEEYKPPKLPGQDDRTYITKPMNHKGRFNAVLPQFGKDRNILLGSRDPVPLTTQEEYKEPPSFLTNVEDVRQGQKRFRTMFPDVPVKKGSTDSNTVKKITFTFPPVKPGF